MANETKHDQPAHLSEGARPKPPSAQDKAAADKARAEQRELTQAASIGAQVILDFNEDAAVGARGGAAGTIEENSMIRDACLFDMGLNPQSPSGPPPSPEVLAARRKREEEQAKEAAEAPKQLPRATRVSSLAADLGDEAKPKAPASKAA